jgi:hypothetical protein
MRPRVEVVYRLANTTSGDQTRCRRGAAVTAVFRAKARMSPSRPQSAVSLLRSMTPPQIDAPEGKPSSPYGEGEVENSTGQTPWTSAQHGRRRGPPSLAKFL